MPHLESIFQNVSRSRCFGKLDAAHGYWQFPLAPQSQEMMSIQTHLGVNSSKRVLQGGCDSGNHFEAVLAEKFQERVQKMLQWMDDFLFHAANEEELLHNIIKSFLHVCQEIGLKINAEKSTCFARKVHFFGRIISADGLQYYPRHYDFVISMRTPTMANKFQQFVCATNWMRNSIPSYSELIAPLRQLLEEYYTRTGKRTKRALRNLSLSNSWGTQHDSAFADIKSQLAASVKLAHPNSDHSMCLFTDASDTHWAAVLTQVPTEDEHKAVHE